jgi:hypothetical protein
MKYNNKKYNNLYSGAWQQSCEKNFDVIGASGETLQENKMRNIL